MTGEAGVGVNCGGMAGAAGGVSVVHATATLVADRRMRASVRCPPVACVVAGDAIRSERAFMVGRVGMAGYARGRRALVNAIDMTFGADCGNVRASQREDRFAVIESGGLPGGGGMAGGTARSIFAAVFIVLRMAGIAILGRASIHAIDVAGGTGRARMFAGQREG